jgi:ABC-type lipoprotein release transport system permease subunit
MPRLILKMLMHKRGTAVAVLSIALLIALVASVDSLLNNIVVQTTALTQLAHISSSYLVVSENSTLPSESQIDASLIRQLRNNTNVAYAVSQQITSATLMVDSANYTVTVRGVDDLEAFFGHYHASINGSISKDTSETDLGTVLSSLVNAHVNDSVTVLINGQMVPLKVVGVIQTSKQPDTELLLPLSTLETFTHNNSVSCIEFSPKNQNKATLTDIIQSLPPDAKLMPTQTLVTFAQGINTQTIIFITCWSTVIYAVVLATSYVLASRLVNEAQYELIMLHHLGVKRTTIISLFMLHTMLVAFVGSAIGVALGIVGTQMAATGVRWLWGNAMLAPFLDPVQALQILLPAFVASLVGGFYPILAATKAAAKGASP